jgi:UDP-N-acetylmuramate--alanine ligase
VFTYSRDKGDFHAENVRIGGGEIVFDFVHPDGVVRDISLGVPLSVNIDNGIAAMALAILNGVDENDIREGMKSFAGVDRRFDFKVKTDKMVFLSDYAHHPNEIEQSVKSVRGLYQDKKIAAIFQPHLYTRTRDFYKEFAAALSLLDCVYLCDIYPARELPIEGVSSQLIYDNLRPGIEKYLIRKEDILDVAKTKNFDVLMSLGAGDIEEYVPRIANILSEQSAENGKLV